MVQVLSTLNGDYVNADDFPTIIEATVQMETERMNGVANSWEVREFKTMYKCFPKNETIDMYRIDG